MTVKSKMAKDLSEVDVIIWDEAPMTPKFALEAVDILLQDNMSSTVVFGGKTVILGGDFRQIPPVVPKGGRNDIVAMSIKNSSLWKEFTIYSLTINVRAQENEDWCSTLLKIGNGEIENSEFSVPEDLRSSGDIVHDIFGDISHIDDIDMAIDRVILTPKNFDSLEINNVVLFIFLFV